MRLDKFLCEMNLGTRSKVKENIKKGQVRVNDIVVKNPDFQINENTDVVCFQGQKINYRKFVYYMLNKPQGVVSATHDNTAGTVIELLKAEDRRKDVFPVGRLDKDTEGFLLLTNDGELAHNLLSPKKHVDKTYLVTLEHEATAKDLIMLETGVDIGEDKPTLPAKVVRAGDRKILLTIHEGKFHQVKRMLQAVGNHVLSLQRISFGGLLLDTCLSPGEYRELTENEVKLLHDA
ncbi:MAG: rRNA pseudouridine synthase [Lachnospiraceae bacterium]|nr:rRNA pseudouridine synthase [Lachnospiraceae bacterium]